MQETEIFYTDEDVNEAEIRLDEARIDTKYKSCLHHCNLLANECRNFIYAANGCYHEGFLSKEQFNDDKKMLDIYERINWIKEELDLVKKHFETRIFEMTEKEKS